MKEANYNLFMIVLPGLEKLAWKELHQKCPASEAQLIKGGIELKASLNWVAEAHLRLKIPTRILIRVCSFKVKDFPKLYQKMSQFNWGPYLSHPNPSWHITCKQSRLMHTERISETMNAAIHEYMRKQPLSLNWKKKNFSPQEFYIRLENDLLTLSLDLSGEMLFKRGLQIFKGEAPLRENIAAALVYELVQNIGRPLTLIDPMCGSGTFLTEAISFHVPLHLRKFAFEEIPLFKGQHQKLPQSSSPLPISNTIGFDLNQDLLNKIKTTIVLKNATLFEAKDSLQDKLFEGPFLMICNPPYGERIKTPDKVGQFLKKAWKKFLTIDRPLKLGWLIPADMEQIFQASYGYKLQSKIKFRNGGLPVVFQVWVQEDVKSSA